MTNKNLRIYITILLATLSIFNALAEDERPNILFILMDDLGYADVGFMPNAAPDIYTPTLDSLATGGMIFTAAHVTHPFCGPSRASIMTGRSPHFIGSQFNLAAFDGNGIDTSETFLSTLLNNAGYYTGIIGKWHLGEEDEFHPNSRGFDYFYGFLGGGHEYFSDSWIPASNYNPSIYKAGNYAGDYKRPMMLNSEYVANNDGLYCTDVLTDAGLNFIDNAASDNKPFFLWMSYNAPHTPVQALQSDIENIKTKLGNHAATDGSERLTYTAMMYNADYNINRLIEKLKSTNLYDNTLIVFLSDNGGKTTAGANNNPLKGKKGDAWEGGFRVPMFFHWPKGNVPQGVLNNDNFSSIDFYPTFAKLAEAEIPSNKKYEGINVWNNIINKTNPRKDSSVVVMRHHNGFNYTGVVKNNYKLYTTGNGVWKLFDLSNDIGETKNIADQHAEIVDSMKQIVYEWTWSHIEPEFFDAPSYGFEDKWYSMDMPNWERMFGEIYDSTNYVVEEVEETGIRLWETAQVTVYPNPVKDVINIDLNSVGSIDVGLYNLQGKLVQLQIGIHPQSHSSYKIKVDENLSNGIYLARVKSRNNYYTQQIMISK